MCIEITFSFGVRADILLLCAEKMPFLGFVQKYYCPLRSWYQGHLDSRAGPFLGYVKKYWFFGEIFTSVNIASLCSITFLSSVYLDCNGQQIKRIATVLLMCSISFSFTSSTNVVGHHPLLSTTLVRWNNAIPSNGQWALATGKLPV